MIENGRFGYGRARWVRGIDPDAFLMCFLVCFAAVVVSFFGLPVVYKSATFALPFQPVESCLGVLCCVHLIVTLGTTAYIRFIAWQGIAIIIYVLYGVHHTSENQESFMPLMVESPI